MEPNTDGQKGNLEAQVILRKERALQKLAKHACGKSAWTNINIFSGLAASFVMITIILSGIFLSDLKLTVLSRVAIDVCLVFPWLFLSCLISVIDRRVKGIYEYFNTRLDQIEKNMDGKKSQAHGG